jgi:hypothetical protein
MQGNLFLSAMLGCLFLNATLHAALHAGLRPMLR